jgi:colanic acid/amylovoran biosynthesis glycosyltransferase
MLERIAVVQPNFNVYSETFIRNHIRGLGEHAVVHDLAGGWVPTHANSRPLAPKWVIWMEKAIAKLLGRSFLHLFLAARVKRYLKEHQIQIVLCEYGPSGVAMMPICRELGIPFVVHFFGLDLHGKKLQAQYGQQYRQMFGEAALIIAISTLQKRVMEAMGADSGKIRHIVCGAERTYLPEKIDTNKPPVFLAVGRMVEKKAPLHTFAAFLKVVQKHPEARLQYVGDGPLKQRCEQFVHENGLEDKVAFLSARKPEFIAQALQGALCFVQHSITASDGDSEGTPVAILDAGLAGVPVVSTRHAGIADTVVDGETGFLVAEHDVEGMAAAMLKLLENPELAHQMGVQASAHVQKNYSLPVTINQLWEALKTAHDAHNYVRTTA